MLSAMAVLSLLVLHRSNGALGEPPQQLRTHPRQSHPRRPHPQCTEVSDGAATLMLERKGGGSIPMSSADGTLTFGYGDDGAQYFAARIAKHIAGPGRRFRIVFVPELCSEMAFRSPSDARFVVKPDDAARLFPKLPFVPDILLCTGWNLRLAIKTLTGALHSLPVSARSSTEHTPVARRGKWNGDVWWPRDAARPCHRRARRPFVIAMMQESDPVSAFEPYDVVLMATTDPFGFARNTPSIFVPDAAQLMAEYTVHSLPGDLVVRGTRRAALARARATLRRKTKLAAFLHAACWKDHYPSEGILRVSLFDRLKAAAAARSAGQGEGAREGGVDALGQCRRVDAQQRGADDGHHNLGDAFGFNCGGPGAELCRRSKGTYLDQAVMLYAPYKFVVAGENSFTAGFVTEKLISPVLAGSVPIYLGPEDAGALFDPRRFVQCTMPPAKVAAMRAVTFPAGESGNLASTERKPSEAARLAWVDAHLGAELDDCVRKVLALDANDEAYARMLAAPLLPGNKVDGSVLDAARIGAAVSAVLDALGSDVPRREGSIM